MHYPVCTVVAYCIGIPLFQKWMENRTSPSLKWTLVLHNLFLCVASGFLAVLMFCKILAFHQSENLPWFEVLCGLTFGQQRGLMTLLHYWNHLLKYYELVDTLFLVLKKKPINFLHAYHHPATLVLTWTQITDAIGIQWMVIWLNLCVHTVMYFYYGLAAMNIQMPFKQLVTVFQIVQFLLDLLACYIGYANVLLGYYRCVGTSRAGFVGCFILTSYLYLFLDFYNDTYHHKKSVTSSKDSSEKSDDNTKKTD